MAKQKNTDFDAAPPDGLGHFHHHFSITMEMDKHPIMGGMFVVALGLVLIYVFRHLFVHSTTSTVQTTTPTLLGEAPPPVFGICPPGSQWIGGQCVPDTNTTQVIPTPPPPTPAPPPVSPPLKPPTPPPHVVNQPPPAAHRTFTVTQWPLPGSSLWTIAAIMYGNPSRWPDIWHANMGLIGNNPNLLHKGWVLTIP